MQPIFQQSCGPCLQTPPASASSLPTPSTSASAAQAVTGIAQLIQLQVWTLSIICNMEAQGLVVVGFSARAHPTSAVYKFVILTATVLPPITANKAMHIQLVLLAKNVVRVAAHQIPSVKPISHVRTHVAWLVPPLASVRDAILAQQTLSAWSLKLAAPQARQHTVSTTMFVLVVVNKPARAHHHRFLLSLPQHHSVSRPLLRLPHLW